MYRKQMTRLVRVCIAALAVTIALPLTALASHPTKKHPVLHQKASYGQATITFGQEGGNMRPWSVSLDSNGTITANDYRKPSNTHLYDAKNTINALQKLADAEGFAAMPAFQSCPKTLPDIAARFVEISTAAGKHRASVRGMCDTQFNELWAALANAASLNLGS